MDSDDSGTFYVKNKIVDASPKKNGWGNTSSECYRHCPWIAQRKQNQFSEKIE